MESIHLLPEFELEVAGQRFPASGPEPGDVTVETGDIRRGSAAAKDEATYVSFGVTELGLPRLELLCGQVAQLRGPRGFQLWLRLEKVDTQLCLAVGEVLPASVAATTPPRSAESPATSSGSSS